jgi:hypothetical protein
MVKDHAALAVYCCIVAWEEWIGYRPLQWVVDVKPLNVVLRDFLIWFLGVFVIATWASRSRKAIQTETVSDMAHERHERPMVFLKSFLAGFAALAGYLVLLCLALWYGPILWLDWQMWRSRVDGGAAAHFYFFDVSLPLFVPGLLAFGAAFWWEWRSASRRAKANAFRKFGSHVVTPL